MNTKSSADEMGPYKEINQSGEREGEIEREGKDSLREKAREVEDWFKDKVKKGDIRGYGSFKGASSSGVKNPLIDRPLPSPVSSLNPSHPDNLPQVSLGAFDQNSLLDKKDNLIRKIAEAKKSLEIALSKIEEQETQNKEWRERKNRFIEQSLELSKDVQNMKQEIKQTENAIKSLQVEREALQMEDNRAQSVKDQIEQELHEIQMLQKDYDAEKNYFHNLEDERICLESEIQELKERTKQLKHLNFTRPTHNHMYFKPRSPPANHESRTHLEIMEKDLFLTKEKIISNDETIFRLEETRRLLEQEKAILQEEYNSQRSSQVSRPSQRTAKSGQSGRSGRSFKRAPHTQASLYT